MSSPVEADAPAPAERDTGAQRDPGSAWRMAKIVFGAVVFVLIVLFVFPGFLAAGFSRAGGEWRTALYGRQFAETHAYPPPTQLPGINRAKQRILAPANWLMLRSEGARKFYAWQYHLAGGEDAELDQ
ncbi:MAG TPA: hypothetical protein VG733_19945 [Chthoniobacteraceae bacterium]|nr:hypothetical protein [Chthoniobacteraceae bacterium]